MSFNWLRNQKYFLFSITIIVIIFAISLILLSELYIPAKLTGYIEKFSDENGYEIEIDDLNFGIISGLKVNKLRFYVPQGSKNPLITVQRLILKPAILSSLFNRGLVVKELLIDKPRVSLTENGFNDIKNLRNQLKREDEPEKEDDKSFVYIGHVEVNEAEIKLGAGKSLSIDKLLLKIEDVTLHTQGILNLGGSITAYNNQADFHGTLKTSSDATSGELYINLAELKIDNLTNVFRIPDRLSASSEIKFKFAREIDLRGLVDVMSDERDADSPSELFAKLNYSLSYDKRSDNLSIDSLNLNMGKLLRSSFDGTIEKLATDGLLKIRGNARASELSRITTFFPGISNYQLSGDIEAGDIELTGSWNRNNISLDGTFNLSGVNVKSVENSFEIVGLKSNLIFKSFFSGNRFGDLSVNGDFTLTKVLTETGELENINGDLEFITNNPIKEGSLLFSLNDLRVKVGHKDSLIISNVRTTNPLKIQFSSMSSELVDNDQKRRHKSDIIFENKGLAYKDLSFKGFVVESGEINDLMIRREGDSKWDLKLIATGSNIYDTDGNMKLSDIQLEMQRDDTGKSLFWGSLEIADGDYNRVKVSKILTTYRILDDSIKLSDIEIALDEVGELKIKTLEIIKGEEGDKFPNQIEFSEGNFKAIHNGVEFKGIRGDFILFHGSNKDSSWDGKVFVDEVNNRSQAASDISLHVNSSPDGIRINELKCRILGGELSGNLLIDTNKSLPAISSSFMIEGANFSSNNVTIRLGKMGFDFNGDLQGGSMPNGTGELRFAKVRIEREGGVSTVDGKVVIQASDETLVFGDGFINNEKGDEIKFSGQLENYLEKNRRLLIDFHNVSLAATKRILWPLLPETLRMINVDGEINLDLEVDSFMTDDSSWIGELSFVNSSFSGDLSGTPISVTGLNGIIKLKEDIKSENPLAALMGKHLKLDKKLFNRFKAALYSEESGNAENFINIDEIKYGFLRLNDIKCDFVVGDEELNLKRCGTKLYGGGFFVTGIYEFDENEGRFNFSSLFEDISLKEISNSVPSIQDYITGRINGLVWVNGQSKELDRIDGLFQFWSFRSKGESRSIGKAFLEKLGAKSRFFLGSRRNYDKGEIAGYIKDGVMSFTEFEISNRVLGYNNLSIRVDQRRNTISIAHLLSVIREISKRASEGSLQIEFGNN